MQARSAAERAVEILCDRGPAAARRWSVGSGYLVGGRWVLTAAHCAGDADSSELLVRCLGAGRPEYRARRHATAAPGVDLAVVEIVDPGFDDRVPPIGWGRIDRTVPAGAVPFWAVGFPAFKEVPDPAGGRRLRETVQLDGRIPTGSNLVRDLLELQVGRAPRPVPPGSLQLSEWQGMSGSVVFAAGAREPVVAVGVVTEHSPDEGGSTLTAVGLDALPGLLDADARADVGLDRECGTYPEPPSGLRAPAYRATIRRFVDRTPELLDRERELAELEAFALGDGTGGYRWISGGPWAGKTALSAHLLDACAGRADCVGYFLARRIGDADSAHFAAAVNSQLAFLLDEPPPGSDDAVLAFADLWQRALDRADRTRRPLLLVVDGLDEDIGPSGAAPLPSVAACLPVRTGGCGRVVVSSRPNPDLPTDVDDDHPLIAARQRARELTPSRYAQELEQRAGRELERLTGDDRTDDDAYDCLGVLTAARGSLTAVDVAAVLGDGGADRRAARRIQKVLGSVLARIVDPTPSPAGRRYTLAHQALAERCEVMFGQRGELDGYRDDVHGWADRYRAAGWPRDTPAYLLDGYLGLLGSTGDTGRMVSYATDRTRQDRMLHLTGGDELAFAELQSVRARIVPADEPDLQRPLVLALARETLAVRNEHIPAGLPAVWTALGQPERGASLARGIADPAHRASCLASLARGTAAAGHRELTAHVLREIADAGTRLAALAAVVTALPATAAPGDAVADLATITDPDRRRTLGTRLAGALARAGRSAAALDVLAAAAPDGEDRYGVAAGPGTVRVLIDAGCDDDAARLARSRPDPGVRAACLAVLAVHAGAAGLPGTALPGATLPGTALPGADPPGADAPVPARVAALLDAARAAALDVDDPAERARALADLAGAALAAGDHATAAGLAGAAESVARAIREPVLAMRALADAVRAADLLAPAADVERLLADVTHPYLREQLLADLAARAVERSALARARSLTGRIDDPVARIAAVARALSHADPVRTGPAAVVELADDLAAAVDAVRGARRDRVVPGAVAALASVGDERARRYAQEVADAATRSSLLCTVAAGLVANGRPEPAAAVADEAESVARELAGAIGLDGVLSDVVDALVRGDDRDLAARLARRIADPGQRDRAVGRIATAAPQEGTALLSTISDPQTRDGALTAMARAAIAEDRLDDAERHVLDVGDTARRQRVLADLVGAMAAAGRHDDAERLARRVRDRDRRRVAMRTVCVELCDAGRTDDAVRLATEFGDHHWLAPLVARALARRGDRAGAERAAQDVVDWWERTRLLSELAVGAARAGDVEWAARHATSARWAMNHVARDRVATLVKVAEAHGAAGLVDEAEEFLRRAERAARRTPALRSSYAASLAEAAGAAHRSGDGTRAGTLLTAAEDAARSIPNRTWRAQALILVARCAARTGDRARARDLLQLADDGLRYTRSVYEPPLDESARNGVLGELVRTLAEIGDTDRADELVARLSIPAHRAEAARHLPAVAAARGDAERALRLAAELPEPGSAARAAADLAVTFAAAGQHDRVARAARTVETAVARVPAGTTRARLVDDLVEILAPAAGTGPDGPDSVTATLRRMVTGVVCSDAWREALPAVARVDLASLQQVGERWWGATPTSGRAGRGEHR